MHKHEKINYIEWPSAELEKTKAFFNVAFGWVFEDYGAEYTAFSNQGVDGGFYRSDNASDPKNGAALVVFYSNNLEKTMQKIEKAGGQISQSIFSFPGGRRFHFQEPCGNEFAVWSDV